MATQFLDNLESVFSILPKDKADEARVDTIQRYLENPNKYSAELKWVDFDQSDAFLRGGAADIAGYAMRIIQSADEDPDIAHMVELSRRGQAIAGRISVASDNSSLIWFLPQYWSKNEEAPSPQLRSLFITERLFNEVLILFNAESGLTKSERRIIFQIVSGLSPKEAGEQDDLSVETKRAQLKAAYGKMDCKSQTELVRTVLGQMTYLLSLCDSEKEQAHQLNKFVRDYMSGDERVVLQRLPNGRTLRLIEYGPASGQPILVIHGMLWPLIFGADNALLDEKNIRIIMPIRCGYLDPTNSERLLGQEDLVGQSLEDVALFHENVLGEKTPVIGNSYGAPMAVEYAVRYPHLVERLFLVAISTAQPDHANRSFIGRFFEGLRDLSHKRGLFRLLTWQFRKYYIDDKTVRRVLRNIFQGSDTDLEVIEGEYKPSVAYPWFANMYKHSVPGVSEDFRYVLKEWDPSLLQSLSDVYFIHGEEDPLSDVRVAEKLAATAPDSRFVTIEGCGHNILASHHRRLWTLIRDRLSEQL
ncbi:MAG: alpha/beta fold hydrolase [Pseudomonadota bacterium]